MNKNKVTVPQFIKLFSKTEKGSHLLDFLRHNKCLKKFISYIDDVNYLEEFCQLHEYGIICSSFLWNETKEGVSYWRKIDSKWKLYLGEIYLNSQC